MTPTTCFKYLAVRIYGPRWEETRAGTRERGFADGVRCWCGAFPGRASISIGSTAVPHKPFKSHAHTNQSPAYFKHTLTTTFVFIPGRAVICDCGLAMRIGALKAQQRRV